MPSPDLTTELRRACLITMKANADLLAIVPKASIHGGVATAPTWPFVKWGVPSSLPLEAACMTGEDVRVAIHGFARARKSGNATVETGEDHAGRLAGAIKRALNKNRLALPSGYATLRWIGGQRMIDGNEADDWHVICEFRARVIAS
jgi:hypothetical protein